MDLLKEILSKFLDKEDINVIFPNLKLSIYEIIIEDEDFSDFEYIEKIVCVLEEFGIGGGSRHDFG